MKSVNAGELLSGIQFEDLPEGETVLAAFVLIKVQNEDGEIGWWTRQSQGADGAELSWKLATFALSEILEEAKAWNGGDDG